MSGDPLSACCKHLANSQHIIEAKNAEIARLRLTDEEREAVKWFAEVRKPLTRLTQSHNRERHKDTLRGLLERLGESNVLRDR